MRVSDIVYWLKLRSSAVVSFHVETPERLKRQFTVVRFGDGTRVDHQQLVEPGGDRTGLVDRFNAVLIFNKVKCLFATAS